MTHAALMLLFGLFLLPGFFMALLPMLPAFWYLLAVAALFGVVDGFVHLTVPNFGVLLGIVALSIIVDWSAGLLGAKFGGAAFKSLLYGAGGAIIGLIALPPLGIFAGLFIGVFVGELLRRRTEKESLRAATGALVGSITGVAINVALAAAFISLFVAFAIA